MRYVLLVQYDGTHFSGYQRQRKARTVQGELERAAGEITGVPTRVVGSGRTDAGVHAAAQVCHFDGETSVPPQKLAECFNRLLPPDCKVLASAAAPAGFDCTRGAKKKTYRYTAYVAPCELPLLGRYAVRLKREPDLARMREAAARIVGIHDFKAFCATGSSAKTSVREIFAADAEREEGDGYTVYRITVTGNGFLYNMVRILAGELFEIGYGKDGSVIEKAFETGDRSLVGKTMPARGLTLTEVDYGVPLFGAPKEE